MFILSKIFGLFGYIIKKFILLHKVFIFYLFCLFIGALLGVISKEMLGIEIDVYWCCIFSLFIFFGYILKKL